LVDGLNPCRSQFYSFQGSWTAVTLLYSENWKGTEGVFPADFPVFRMFRGCSRRIFLPLIAVLVVVDLDLCSLFFVLVSLCLASSKPRVDRFNLITGGTLEIMA